MPNVTHLLVDEDGFRIRGTEVSRVEAFSDVVFGFAVTLLVVSLEVPKTYSELRGILVGFAPFAISFAILSRIWLDHYRFFRRFGLHNLITIRINAVLLFVLLFYIYPLKFLFTIAVPALDASRPSPFSGAWQIRELMVMYGVGFAAIYGLIALLNYQGWRHREQLKLTPIEEMLTRSYMIDTSISALIGLLSCVVACILPPADAGYAGFTFLLIYFHKSFNTRRFKRKIRLLRELDERLEAADQT